MKHIRSYNVLTKKNYRFCYLRSESITYCENQYSRFCPRVCCLFTQDKVKGLEEEVMEKVK